MENTVYQQVSVRIATVTMVFFGYCSLPAFASDVKKNVLRENRKTIEGMTPYLEDPRREKENQVERVIETFGVSPGNAVADVGAGTGLFTFPLAVKVGGNGKVYAVEIVDEMLRHIGKKAKEYNLKNIQLVKSSESDPNLPHSSCDKIVVANTYHHIGDRVAFMTNLRKALKNGGSVAIISTLNAIKPPKIISEMEQAGFKLYAKHDFLKNRLFLVFKQ